jgi:hypothetical protein
MMIVCYVFGLQKRPVRKREERGIWLVKEAEGLKSLVKETT